MYALLMFINSYYDFDHESHMYNLNWSHSFFIQLIVHETALVIVLYIANLQLLNWWWWLVQGVVMVLTAGITLKHSGITEITVSLILIYSYNKTFPQHLVMQWLRFVNFSCGTYIYNLGYNNYHIIIMYTLSFFS